MRHALPLTLTTLPTVATPKSGYAASCLDKTFDLAKTSKLHPANTPIIKSCDACATSRSYFRLSQ